MKDSCHTVDLGLLINLNKFTSIFSIEIRVEHYLQTRRYSAPDISQPSILGGSIGCHRKCEKVENGYRYRDMNGS
jgi:hypothetical protein